MQKEEFLAEFNDTHGVQLTEDSSLDELPFSWDSLAVFVTFTIFIKHGLATNRPDFREDKLVGAKTMKDLLQWLE